MKKIIIALSLVLTFFSCQESFLDIPPATGLTNDKLVDLSAMRGLINGAYSLTRGGQGVPYCGESSLYATAMVRDVVVRNNTNFPQFFDHLVANDLGMFVRAYRILNGLNTIAEKDLSVMEGTDAQRQAVLGDMHFLRALIYFDLNNYFELPSTGYSVPLLLKPLGVDEKVSCSKIVDVRDAIEKDIEQARLNFKNNVSGVSNYQAATALAARIYFFHRKYDKAYAMADEVIKTGNFILEADVMKPFTPPGSSRENIFSFKFNAGDNANPRPTSNLRNAYQPNEATGSLSLNPDGVLSKLMKADPKDARWGFYTEKPGITYINGKYSSDQMDMIYIRLAEMYLTRAESNIMNNNTVGQQDVDDINKLRSRANPATVLTSIPVKNAALDTLYNDRTKELAIELGDHYLNTRRLQKGIVKTAKEGGGIKPYSQYADLLAFPFPLNEINIHQLTRKP
jgi:starch-binding outer membrane protein, SusD/RagB family